MMDQAKLRKIFAEKAIATGSLDAAIDKTNWLAYLGGADDERHGMTLKEGEKVERVVWQEVVETIQSSATVHDSKIKAWYIGRNQYRALRAAVEANVHYATQNLAKGERMTFFGKPVYVVDEDDHIQFV